MFLCQLHWTKFPKPFDSSVHFQLYKRILHFWMPHQLHQTPINSLVFQFPNFYLLFMTAFQNWRLVFEKKNTDKDATIKFDVRTNKHSILAINMVMPVQHNLDNFRQQNSMKAKTGHYQVKDRTLWCFTLQ